MESAEAEATTHCTEAAAAAADAADAADADADAAAAGEGGGGGHSGHEVCMAWRLRARQLRVVHTYARNTISRLVQTASIDDNGGDGDGDGDGDGSAGVFDDEGVLRHEISFDTLDEEDEEDASSDDGVLLDDEGDATRDSQWDLFCVEDIALCERFEDLLLGEDHGRRSEGSGDGGAGAAGAAGAAEVAKGEGGNM